MSAPPQEPEGLTASEWAMFGASAALFGALSVLGASCMGAFPLIVCALPIFGVGALAVVVGLVVWAVSIVIALATRRMTAPGWISMGVVAFMVCAPMPWILTATPVDGAYHHPGGAVMCLGSDGRMTWTGSPVPGRYERTGTWEMTEVSDNNLSLDGRLAHTSTQFPFTRTIVLHDRTRAVLVRRGECEADPP